MKVITECVFDTEDFKQIGFTDISTEYRLTLRRSSLEECGDGVMYQVYRASVPDEDFEIPCEHSFYLVVEVPLDKVPNIDEARIWAMSESAGGMIIRQYYSLSYDMIVTLDETQDESGILLCAGLFDGMSRAEVEEEEL